MYYTLNLCTGVVHYKEKGRCAKFFEFLGKKIYFGHKFMKKILLIILPLLLTACMYESPGTDIKADVKTEAEVVAPENTPVQEPAKKTAPAKKAVKSDSETKTDTSTDGMTEELDKLIDDIIGG